MMSTFAAPSSRLHTLRPGRRMLWAAPWLAVVVMVLTRIEDLRTAVERSANPAVRELPDIALTSAVITTIVAYWVALGVAQVCALMLDRWFDDRGWTPLGSRMCIAVGSGTALLVLAAQAFANLGPGAGDVPGWVRILLGGGIALLAGLHLNRSSGDRRVIGPPLGALGLAGVIALSF
jgi:hypothetical protein